MEPVSSLLSVGTRKSQSKSKTNGRKTPRMINTGGKDAGGGAFPSFLKWNCSRFSGANESGITVPCEPVVAAKLDEFIRREQHLDLIRRKYDDTGQAQPLAPNNTNNFVTRTDIMMQAAIDSITTACQTSTNSCIYDESIQRQEDCKSSDDVQERNERSTHRYIAEGEARPHLPVNDDTNQHEPISDNMMDVYNRLYNYRRREKIRNVDSEHITCKKIKLPKKHRRKKGETSLAADEPSPRSTLVDTNAKLIESFFHTLHNGEQTDHTTTKNGTLATPDHAMTTFNNSLPTSTSTSASAHSAARSSITCIHAAQHHEHQDPRDHVVAKAYRTINHLNTIQDRLNQGGNLMNSSSRYQSRLDQAVQKKYKLQLSVEIVPVVSSSIDNMEMIEMLLISPPSPSSSSSSPEDNHHHYRHHFHEEAYVPNGHPTSILVRDNEG